MKSLKCPPSSTNCAERNQQSGGRPLVRLTLKRKTDLGNVARINPSKRRKEIAEEFGVALTIITGIFRDKGVSVSVG